MLILKRKNVNIYLVTYFYNETRFIMDYKAKYQKWINSAVVDENTKDILKKLNEKEIEDSFYCDLEFGTGGLRGVMGPGTNRMNIYTVRLATQGLANEISDCGEDCKKRGVVIAHDSRNNSPLFANECAKVLCANGIKTYLFDSLRPTPELSFAVRHLNCARGIVITASHNPKEYNGYKVYGEDGGQLAPENADVIIDYIKKTDIFEDIKLCDSHDAVIINEDVDREYIKAVKSQSFGVAIPDDFKVVYTPLHGSGNVPVTRILREMGVKNLFVVPEQEKPDGDFPTVVSPNPENAEAFTISTKYAKEMSADLIFGTDPDSDRIGVVVKNSAGEFIVLNGNQTGVLLCEYILRKAKENGTLHKNGAVIKTIVTTEMVTAIAHAYGVELIDVLTGFKFIGDKIKGFEDGGDADRFIFGLEESYGYLKGSYARDKDAVVAAMLVVEAAADYKTKGMTLYDGLLKLYEEYGFFKEYLENITLKGIEGTAQIKKIMEVFRTEEFPIEIEKKLDYLDGIDGLPKSNVLKFFHKDGWIAMRPSGTEPKIKFYFGIKADNSDKADNKLLEVKKAVMDKVNSIIE